MNIVNLLLGLQLCDCLHNKHSWITCEAYVDDEDEWMVTKVVSQNCVSASESLHSFPYNSMPPVVTHSPRDFFWIYVSMEG